MKRLLDIVVASAVLVLLSPALLLVGILIRWKIGPPLFRQDRPGKRAVPFAMLKFRTMSDERDGDGSLLPDSERMTSLGALLRSTSFDEIPELLNVLRGEMSLVGPRPLLIDYLPLYSESQNRRHEIKPGVTGWAQVNGRNALSWDSRFELDVWYVDNRSFLLDLRILWLTLHKVVRREGIAAEGEATMAAFRGAESSSDVGRIS